MNQITAESTNVSKLATLKTLTRALAPVAIYVAVGVGCGLVINKIRNSSNDTES